MSDHHLDAAIARIAERNRALETLDLDYARKMLPGASSNAVLLLALHKARYECVMLSPEFRHASEEWLRERGYGRFDGTPLLPLGELPV